MAKTTPVSETCPMDAAINLLSGKWKLAILWQLSKNTVRFNEFQRLLPNITQKTLTMQLRELEKADVIYRKVYPEVPPKVEYGLTETGESLRPLLAALCEWGKVYQKNH